MVIQSSRSRGCPVCSSFTKHALKKIILTIMIIMMVTKIIAKTILGDPRAVSRFKSGALPP